MKESDIDLISRYASNRDSTCFAELVSRHSDMVFATAVRVVGERTVAEKVTQDCFVRLATQPGRVRTSVAGWLHRTAVNASIDVVRQRRARRERTLVLCDLSACLMGRPA